VTVRCLARSASVVVDLVALVAEVVLWATESDQSGYSGWSALSATDLGPTPSGHAVEILFEMSPAANWPVALALPVGSTAIVDSTGAQPGGCADGFLSLNVVWVTKLVA
jgi:hypothetical protein